MHDQGTYPPPYTSSQPGSHLVLTRTSLSYDSQMDGWMDGWICQLALDFTCHHPMWHAMLSLMLSES